MGHCLKKKAKRPPPPSKTQLYLPVLPRARTTALPFVGFLLGFLGFFFFFSFVPRKCQNKLDTLQQTGLATPPVGVLVLRNVVSGLLGQTLPVAFAVTARHVCSQTINGTAAPVVRSWGQDFGCPPIPLSSAIGRALLQRKLSLVDSPPHPWRFQFGDSLAVFQNRF